MRIQRCQRKESIETSACQLLVVPDPYLNTSLFWESGAGEMSLHPPEVFYNAAQRIKRNTARSDAGLLREREL
jgi:hypothetical protein